MPSKLVTDRQKSAHAVIAAVRTHGPAAADTVAKTFAPFVAKGEKQPDIAALLQLSARVLEKSIDAAVVADEAHEAELADDHGPRKLRDTQVETLYADVVELREVAVGLLGRSVTSLLRLDGTTPRDPVVLVRQAGEIAGALENAKLPKSRVRGAKFHADEWASRLRDDAKALAKTLELVAREAREAEATLVAKNAALAEYDATFSSVATVVSGLLRMGGNAELAARVRPSPRRPGRTVELGEEAPSEPAVGDGATTDAEPVVVA